MWAISVSPITSPSTKVFHRMPWWIEMYFRCQVNMLSCIQLFVTPWTVAHQSPLSMYSKQNKKQHQWWPQDVTGNSAEVLLLLIMCCTSRPRSWSFWVIFVWPLWSVWISRELVVWACKVECLIKDTDDLKGLQELSFYSLLLTLISLIDKQPRKACKVFYAW